MMPAFLVTIDTEGDNVWSKPRTTTTHNAAFLPRFQQMCDRYGIRPTYLTNHEMGCDPRFQEFGRDLLARGVGEIGMHLHAWDSPPLIPLTADDRAYQPYLIEYPDAVMHDKIRAVTTLLENTFGVKMRSHRAGRWAMDERYATLLLAEGYRVDCSVTPLLSWRSWRGHPAGSGGVDYTRFPSHPYWMDLTDISQPGDSQLLQVPVTILPGRLPVFRRITAALDRLPPALAGATDPVKRLLHRVAPNWRWFRPHRRTLPRLRQLLEEVRQRELTHAQLAFHSSELMPGGSPTFRTAAQIDQLFHCLTALFELAARHFTPLTLAEYHDRFAARHPPPVRHLA